MKQYLSPPIRRVGHVDCFLCSHHALEFGILDKRLIGFEGGGNFNQDSALQLADEASDGFNPGLNSLNPLRECLA